MIAAQVQKAVSSTQRHWPFDLSLLGLPIGLQK